MYEIFYLHINIDIFCICIWLRSLENVKAEARKENEILQERIVRICTSVLENFGPYSMDRRRCNSFQTKPCRKLKYQKKIMNKLHKKVNANHYIYYI